MYNAPKNLQRLQQPGEYGKSHAPIGWAMINLSDYNGGRIFLSSHHLANDLSNHYHIPPNNIVRLISDPPIPEASLAGAEGLTQFKNKLAIIQNPAEDILIHCVRGNNRTPVAAYIYMIDKLNI